MSVIHDVPTRQTGCLVIPLSVVGNRNCEVPAVLSIGVPLSQGAFRGRCARLQMETEIAIPCQTKVLQHWPDGSVKWLMASWLLPAEGGAGVELLLAATEEELPAAIESAGVTLRGGREGALVVDTGVARFRLSPGSDRVLDGAEAAEGDSRLGSAGVRLVLADRHGKRRPVTITALHVLEEGPVRVQVAIDGVLGRGTGLRIGGVVSFFAGQSQVRVELTAQNPRRARHAGGYWDLGDAGSVLLKEWSVEVDAAVGATRHVEWLEQPAGSLQRSEGESFSFTQESSGGVNWKSFNHLNREGRVPLRFRGYRVRSDAGESSGERASPVVGIRGERGFVSCAVEEFWEKFPTAIGVDGNRLSVQFWPGDSGDLHELQAGEHATRTFWLNVGAADETCEGLSSIYDPPIVVVDPAWIAASGCVPYFPAPGAACRNELARVLETAIEGESSLFAKREVIDEFGWRNFGDVWADHEEAYCEAPRPVISHYNNQYDLLHGLLMQYLLTGDARWWRLADPLARHIVDIDIYHTDRDKPAYNGGLFWHTAHYHAAGRCTHRTMSLDMRGKKIPAGGTGPGNEHNYSSGLLLYYWLTGSAKARETVVGLADWVIAMDDGSQHVLGVASQLPTGDASRTAQPGYHGPGRGAGNSINALLNGWYTTGGVNYLQKAGELIRRTIHPCENIQLRQLGDAELRWSYTVYLQALLRFIEATEGVDEVADCCGYARESVLSYARWMVKHERFYLDHPEELEYPTETWAAQELRKGTVLLMAASHAASEEAAAFRARGQQILDKAWPSLLSFPSYGCTRAVALALQQGHLEAFLNDMAAARQNAHRATQNDCNWPPVSEFVPQKTAVKTAMRSARGWLGMARSMAQPQRWSRALSQTWGAERIRRLWN